MDNFKISGGNGFNVAANNGNPAEELVKVLNQMDKEQLEQLDAALEQFDAGTTVADAETVLKAKLGNDGYNDLKTLLNGDPSRILVRIQRQHAAWSEVTKSVKENVSPEAADKMQQVLDAGAQQGIGYSYLIGQLGPSLPMMSPVITDAADEVAVEGKTNGTPQVAKVTEKAADKAIELTDAVSKAVWGKTGEEMIEELMKQQEEMLNQLFGAFGEVDGEDNQEDNQ